MSFRPKLSCTYRSRSTSTNIYGEYVYDAAVSSACSILKTNLSREQTSVRADSAASRGNAYENVGWMLLGFQASVGIKQGDIITLPDRGDYRVEDATLISGRKGCANYSEVTVSVWKTP